MSDFSEYSDRKLTSDRYADLVEALETLYIKGNISGRNHFTLDWPDVAAFLFGDELLRCDREGTKDRKRRAELEVEAEEKRAFLVETLETLEKRSVDKGSLQVDYVRGLMNDMGRKLSLCVYASWLVDRFIPPAAGEIVVDKVEKKVEVAKKVDLGAPKPWEAAAHTDSMAHVKPISVDSANVLLNSEAQAPKKTSIIIGTQQAQGMQMPTAPVQESVAPVVGGQKGGLKIMSISEAAPEKPEGETSGQ